MLNFKNKLYDFRDKLFTLLDRKYPILMAYYRKLKLKDKDVYWESSHLFRRKKIIAKEKYCVFRIEYPNWSLFSVACQYIFMCEWALNKGFIPLVDLEYQYNFDQHKIGEDNVWEYCFQQPISMSQVKEKEYVYLHSCYQYDNVYLEKTCKDINGKKDDVYIHITQENWRKYYSNINKYVKKYWVFKQAIWDEFEWEYEIQMRKAQHLLGIFLREDWSEEYYQYLGIEDKKVFDMHPRVPSVSETINIVKEYLQKWECDHIFLSTLYQDSVERFREAFGDKIIVVDRIRHNSIGDVAASTENLFSSTAEEKRSNIKWSVEKKAAASYIKEVIALSRCDYLIAARGRGATAALSLNGGKYRDIYILEDKNNCKRY